MLKWDTNSEMGHVISWGAITIDQKWSNCKINTAFVPWTQQSFIVKILFWWFGLIITIWTRFVIEKTPKLSLYYKKIESGDFSGKRWSKHKNKNFLPYKWGTFYNKNEFKVKEQTWPYFCNFTMVYPKKRPVSISLCVSQFNIVYCKLKNVLVIKKKLSKTT